MTAKSKQEEKPTKKSETPESLESKKACFIITPIGANGSDTFSKTEGLIQSVLVPVLEQFGFEPIPAHYINKSGSINKQIIEYIVNSELVIANLTGVNPNVMYELAIRHSFGKKVITMAERGTKLPFDIVDQRTLFYEDSMKGVDEIKPLLHKAIEVCLNNNDDEQQISNPIYDALNQFAQIKNLPEDQQDGFEIVLNRLDRLENDIIKNRNANINGPRRFAIDPSLDSSKLYKVLLDIDIPFEDVFPSIVRVLDNYSTHISFQTIPKKVFNNGTSQVELFLNVRSREFLKMIIAEFRNIPGIVAYKSEQSEAPF